MRQKDVTETEWEVYKTMIRPAVLIDAKTWAKTKRKEIGSKRMRLECYDECAKCHTTTTPGTNTSEGQHESHMFPKKIRERLLNYYGIVMKREAEHTSHTD